MVGDEVRNRDRGQNTDDRDHDHQLDQGKTLLTFKRLTHPFASLLMFHCPPHCRFLSRTARLPSPGVVAGSVPKEFPAAMDKTPAIYQGVRADSRIVGRRHL